MKPLNLRNALALYDVLGKYVPEETYEDGLEFVGKIVENIISANKHKDFVQALLLMTNSSKEDLLTLDGSNTVSLFIECLTDNKFMDLLEFCRKVGYHG